MSRNELIIALAAVGAAIALLALHVLPGTHGYIDTKVAMAAGLVFGGLTSHFLGSSRWLGRVMAGATSCLLPAGSRRPLSRQGPGLDEQGKRVDPQPRTVKCGRDAKIESRARFVMAESVCLFADQWENQAEGFFT